jgi:proteasome lid subunit RPN8/RPN11
MLLLDRAGRATIVAEARRAFPGECCGFLFGTRDGGRATVTDVRPAVNARAGDARAGDARAGTPPARFAIAPEEVLRAHREAEARGLELVGFYHSHPDGGAAPSRLDREHAWPGCRHVIVAVRDGEPGELRAWVPAAAGGELVEEPVGEDR